MSVDAPSDKTPLNPVHGRRSALVWLSAALAAAAGASVFMALGQAALAAITGALALGSAGAAVRLTVRKSEIAAAAPTILTDRWGRLIGHTDAAQALLSRAGIDGGPTGFFGEPQTAAALFALRRLALTGGPAEGPLGRGGLRASVHADGDTLVHTLALAPEAAEADAAAALAAQFVDALPVAAAVVDPAGAVIASNEEFRTLLGPCNTLSEPLALEEDVFARLARQAEGPRGGRVDAALRGADDRRVRLNAKPFGADPADGAMRHARTDDPHVAQGGRILVVVSDVTVHSELEAQVAQSQKMQAIGQLAGGIAHDFNNVLTAIIGFSDLLLQNHRPSDPAFRDILNIKQSAQRAAGLVKQLLAFSRRQTLRPTVLNLNDVLADLVMMLDRLLGETIRLEISYGRDLWPVLADLSQIEQVVINLSVNARDAMQGGGELTIRTRNVAAGSPDTPDEIAATDAVLIEIEDVGTGMPQHVLEKIFEPFFTTKATGEGTGLGLSTVYGIVTQTGGSLSVVSQEGAGTTFRVFLPRANVETKPAPDAAREQAPTPADLTGNATLLLAEDEEAIRAFAARALSAKGYTVIAAASGLEAAEIFDERGDEIDLILTDVIMPELDGPSLVEHVRKSAPHMKVIFMSGYADGASVDDLGGATFLPKPFTLKALAEAVKNELSAS